MKTDQNTVMFKALTYKEITIQLLLCGLLTLDQAVILRIDFKHNILKTIIYN